VPAAPPAAAVQIEDRYKEQGLASAARRTRQMVQVAALLHVLQQARCPCLCCAAYGRNMALPALPLLPHQTLLTRIVAYAERVCCPG
jgi:hypothetical protein